MLPVGTEGIQEIRREMEQKVGSGKSILIINNKSVFCTYARHFFQKVMYCCVTNDNTHS